jgi:hypothetical protein
MNTELPSVIIEGDLTIEEIGAIFIMFSLKNVAEDIKSKWTSNDELSRIFRELQDKKMLKNDNGNLVIDIVNQSKDEFFYIEDYDDRDNPIYASPSPYGDETDTFMWRVRPELWDMRILWINCSDQELIDENSELTFDSLEEAEKYFSDCNENIEEKYIISPSITNKN